jgi:hypothetical protein
MHSTEIHIDYHRSNVRKDADAAQTQENIQVTGFEDTKLSSNVTIRRYREMEAAHHVDDIADFMYQRFTERYINPMESIPRDSKNGFSIMAVSCLMIESLESFWQGWPTTETPGKQAFVSFFARPENKPLADFKNVAEDFYKHIRCGILHQAETTGGWRIRRKGPLFDTENRTINATKFHRRLHCCLVSYCDMLRESGWDSDVWENLRKKMDAVCENCKPGKGE